MVKNDFMTIRQYVVDRIAVSGSQPIKFPPTRELGKQFGVSQPTALRAIKDLINDGFLEPCKGGGTISCAEKTSNVIERKIFGLLTHMGQQSFDTYYFARLNAAVVLELTKRSYNYCTQQVYLESASLLEKVVGEKSLSGLALVSVKGDLLDYAKKVKSKGLPVVSLSEKVEGLSSFYDPIEDRYCEILEMLFKENRTHILITALPREAELNPIKRAIELSCKRHNIPEKQIILVALEERERKARIEEVLSFGMRFEGVVFYNRNMAVYDLICEHHDIKEECRFVCDESEIYDDMNYTGYVVNYNWEKSAKGLVDNLLAQIESPAIEPVYEKIEYTITFKK